MINIEVDATGRHRKGKTVSEANIEYVSLFATIRSYRLRLPWPLADRVSLSYCLRRYVEGIGTIIANVSLCDWLDAPGVPGHWKVHP